MLNTLGRSTPLKPESGKLSGCAPDVYSVMVCVTVTECEASSTSVRLTEYGIADKSDWAVS
jgi:hypothetical protein